MRGVLYSTDTVDGPDSDLEKDEDCPDCAGLGNILVIENPNGFACCGDSPRVRYNCAQWIPRLR